MGGRGETAVRVRDEWAGLMLHKYVQRQSLCLWKQAPYLAYKFHCPTSYFPSPNSQALQLFRNLKKGM